MPQIQPIAARNVDRSQWIREKVTEALHKIFPYETTKYIIKLSNVTIVNKNYSISDQKKAILAGRTLSEPVYGDLSIFSKATKRLVEKVSKFKLADVPFLTQRLTMILEGNDYAVTNQLRMKSGVYTRRRENDVVEAFFNLAAGRNFRMIMDPAQGLFYIEIENTKIPLYPILISFGVSDVDLKNIWGNDLLRMNREKGKNPDVAINSLYGKLFRNADPSLSPREKVIKIGNYFDGTKMDESVNASTIGVKAGKVTVDTLLNASKKILGILRNKESTDDRDNLKYQTVHTIDDAISENIEKTAPEILRKIKYKLDSLPKDAALKDSLPTNMFGPTIKKFLTTTSIAAPLPQVNPVDIMGSAYEVTHMGPGGIKDIRQVRPETREVNSSHIGVIDPVNTKENEKAGVTLFTTPTAFKDKSGNIYTKLHNIRLNRQETIPVSELEEKVVAFPGQDLSKKSAKVEVLYQGRVQKLPASKVEYQLSHHSDMFSNQTNLIPFLNSISGGRALMAAKHYTHSLPLKYREAPLVQTKSNSPFGTEERKVASFFLPKAKANGVVDKITDDTITIKNARGESITDVYETNFPLNQKTFLHTDLNVKKGDKVSKNQLLGESIYTKDGDLALGKNLKVAYMTYKGLNINDGMVISESAANKLTSLHMNKVLYMTDDNHEVSKTKFTVRFPNKFNIDQLRNVDSDGIVKKGSILKEGDPIVLGIEKTELSAEQSLLGKLHKRLYMPYREDAVVWHNPFDGEVTDIQKSGNRIVVLIRSEQPAQVGDKLSQRSAGKGVITAIIKDSEMVQDTDGNPIDVVVSPTGVISRQNPAQIMESSVAKVAQKLGKPIVVDNFKGDNHAMAKSLLKKYGMSDKETVFDPVNQRKINGVMVGPQYILKQSNQVGTGFSARNFGVYDSNELPAKGGEEGSKTVGLLDINSLLTHNSRNLLKEISTIKGTKNTPFWSAYMRGLPLPTPKTPFAYDKLLGMITASGIKLNKEDNRLIAAPLTDKEIVKMSKGAITSPYTVRAKDLRPEKDGLFDINVTGGLSGRSWGHIDLEEPVINPVMKDPVKITLGLTSKQLDEKIKSEGVGAISKELSKIDVDSRIKQLHKDIPNLKHNNLNRAIKEMKYLKALKTHEMRPNEAYILNKIPVLPPIMRPITKLAGSKDLTVSAANRLYADVIHHNNAFKESKKFLGPAELSGLRGTMQQSVEALVGTADSPNFKLQKQGVKGILTTIAGGKPKEGFFQSKVLSKPQDLAGRGVIAPVPTLGMDQISVPEEMLWRIFMPMVVRRLVSRGYSAVQAQQMVKDKHEIAKQELLAETKERPVLMNRAPNLHKYNIIGAYAVPTSRKTIGVSPFVEKGQGADFDGDTMQLHVPVSPQAVAEAKNMTLSKMLFTDKTKSGNLMAKPEQDTNYGIFRGINSSPTGKTQTFKSYDEVKRAYKQGAIGLNDKIRIQK